MMVVEANRPRLIELIVSVVLGVGAVIAVMIRYTSDISYASIQSFCSQALDSVVNNGPLAPFIVVVALAFVIYRCIPSVSAGNMRSYIVSGICALLLSLTLIVPGQWSEGQESSTGYPWYSNGIIAFDSPVYCVVFLLQWLTVSAVLFVVFCHLFAIDSYNSRMVRLEKDAKFSVKTRLDSFISSLDLKPRHVLTYSVILFICWIPILVINGPVIIPMDTMVQLIQMRGFRVWDPMMMTYLDGYTLSDHNPFFDSFIYGAFDRIGLMLGHEMWGFVLYIWGQAFIGAFSLVLMLAWINSRIHLNSKIMLFFMGFVAFVPSFSSYLTVIMKDSTWIPFFTVWMVLYFELVYRLKNKKKIRWEFVFLLIVVSVLAGLMKKTSIYVTTPSLFLLIIFCRDKIKIAASAVVPALIAIILIPSVVFPIMKIAPGGSQEMLGLPMQQIAKVLLEHEGDISQKDLHVISEVMDTEKAKNSWKPSTEDPVKQSFRTGVSRSGIISFIMVWLKLFFRYPAEYFAAVPFLRNAFLIGPTYYTNGSLKCGWEPNGGYAILSNVPDCSYSWAQEHVSNPLMNVLNRIPPFSLIGAEGLFTAWIPLLSLGFCVYKRNWNNLLLYLPVLFMAVFQLLLPAHQVRYSLGFLFSFALVAVIPWISMNVGTVLAVSTPSTNGTNDICPGKKD